MRLQAAQAELAQTQQQLTGLEAERSQQHAFLAQAQQAVDSGAAGHAGAAKRISNSNH